MIKYITIMNKQGFRGVMLLLIFVWAGMVLGISFLEAPLKFQAPNVTLAIGVGIGRLVFGTLNKIEIVFSASLVLLSIVIHPSRRIVYFLSFIIMVLMVQSLWLLPALDARAQLIAAGGVPSGKSPHLFYVAGEVAKLPALVWGGLVFFSESVKTETKAKI
jgi:hypothetical protein